MPSTAAAIWSAVAASFAALSSVLIMMIQRRNLLESARPELVLIGWSRQACGQGDAAHEILGFERIKNVGRGPALHIVLNSSQIANNRPTAAMSTLRLPILAPNEESPIDGRISLWWKNVEPNREGHKQRRNMRHRDRFARGAQTLAEVTLRPAHDPLRLGGPSTSVKNRYGRVLALDHHMTRLTSWVAVIIACNTLGACAHLKPRSKDSYATAETRHAAIQRAQVWAATDIPSMNLRTGPEGPAAFPPGATIDCNYLDKKLGGSTPKFACVVPPEDELKVKYGKHNGEVYAEVAAARLFWALGFGAERMYPVRVVCHGCPASILHDTEFASVQRKLPGTDIDTVAMPLPLVTTCSS